MKMKCLLGVLCLSRWTFLTFIYIFFQELRSRAWMWSNKNSKHVLTLVFMLEGKKFKGSKWRTFLSMLYKHFTKFLFLDPTEERRDKMKMKIESWVVCCLVFPFGWLAFLQLSILFIVFVVSRMKIEWWWFDI